MFYIIIIVVILFYQGKTVVSHRLPKKYNFWQCTLIGRLKNRTIMHLIIIILLYFYLFNREKPLVAQKLEKENYKIRLKLNPTLAGRHQRNRRAAPQRKYVGIKTKMLEHRRSSSPIASCPTRSRTEEHRC